MLRPISSFSSAYSMKPKPVPPASGGRCGAQMPAAFALRPQLLDQRVGRLVLARQRRLVRIDVLLHERAHLGAALGHLRLERELGHQRESARVGAGSQVQNAIYLAGGSRVAGLARGVGGARARDARAGAVRLRRRRRRLGGDVRANREAFERRRLRPRMLVGTAERDLSVEVLGLRSPAPFLLAPGRRPLDRPPRGRARRRPRLEGDRRADGPLERRVDPARGRRRRARRRAALVPALLVVATASSRAASSTAPARPATARSSSRSTRSRSAGATATSGTATCPSCGARGWRSSSATRSSASGSTRRRRRTCRRRR